MFKRVSQIKPLNVRTISRSIGGAQIPEEFAMKTDYFQGLNKNSWGVVPPARAKTNSKTLSDVFEEIDSSENKAVSAHEIRYACFMNGIYLNEDLIQEMDNHSKDGAIKISDLKILMEKFHIIVAKKDDGSVENELYE